jgi:hypothetical protein
VLTDIALKVLHGEPVDLSTGRVNVIWQRDAVEHILCSTRIAASPAVPLNITGAPEPALLQPLLPAAPSQPLACQNKGAVAGLDQG